MAMDHKEDGLLRDRLSQNISDLKRWVTMWSFIHHTFLFGAAVLSTSAAVFLQWKVATSDELLQKNIASALAAGAALTGVIAASGAFERKWRACRLTRGRLMELEIDLTPQNADSTEMKERYKAIWRDHEQGIVGPGK
jgi:hypothetical protein